MQGQMPNAGKNVGCAAGQLGGRPGRSRKGEGGWRGGQVVGMEAWVFSSPSSSPFWGGKCSARFKTLFCYPSTPPI